MRPSGALQVLADFHAALGHVHRSLAFQQTPSGVRPAPECKSRNDDTKSFSGGRLFGAGQWHSPRQTDRRLRDATDREKEYARIQNWRTVSEAGRDIYQARLTLREQRIFMPADLTKEFSDVIERMSGAQIQRRLHLEHPHIPEYNYGKASTGWLEDCVPVFDRMASLANQRLFRAERKEREIGDRQYQAPSPAERGKGSH